MDIHAAIQALIASNSALQMEVIHLALFVLAVSIFKLNRGIFFWKLKCGIISKVVFKTENLKLFSSVIKQKYMHKMFHKETISSKKT